MSRVFAARVVAFTALTAAIVAGMLVPQLAAAATPASPTLRLSIPDAFLVSHHLATVPGRVVQIKGSVSPYVPGQAVVVQASVAGKQFKTETLRINPAPGGSNGRFTETLKSPRAGDVTVAVTHAATPTFGAFSGTRRFAALDEHVGFGSRGPSVELIQQRLAALHFYIPQPGVFDTGTGLALDAYHRLLHWGTYQTLDSRTSASCLTATARFRSTSRATAITPRAICRSQLLALILGLARPGDLSDQLRQALDADHPGQLPRLLQGAWLPARRDVLLQLLHQRLRHPRLRSGARYPASHGCMRLPIVDALSVYDWLQIGDWVDTYY